MDILGNSLGGLFIFVAVLAVIFLVFREFFCWYWKINQNIALLTEIRELLSAKGSANGNVTAPPAQTTHVGGPGGTAGKLCKACGTSEPAGSDFCTNCGAKL